MPDQTVHTESLGRIVAAEAEFAEYSTDELMVLVTDGAHCTDTTEMSPKAGAAFLARWSTPLPESHPFIPQHRWDERVSLIAERLCAPCPVRTACLALAERLPMTYSGGIRGGVAPQHRRLSEAVTAGEVR
jgi:hypothetical protein